MEEKELRRLSDCEILINKYYQMIQSYIKQMDTFDKDVVMKKDLFKHMKSQRDLFSKEIEVIMENNANVYSEFQGCVKKVEDNKQLSNVMNDSLKSFAHDLMILFSHIDFLKNKNSEVNQRVDSLNLRMPNREKIQQDQHEIKMRFSAVFEDLQRQIDALRNDLKKDEARIREVLGKLSNQNDLQMKMHLDSIQTHESLENQIKDLRSIHRGDKEELMKKMDNLPIPELPKMPDFEKMAERIQKSVMDKVEEESNKYMKAIDLSMLNDIQIRVLNKKMDSILSVLEKNKLS